MSNNISQEAALVGHIAEKGAPGKDGKTPVKGVDYWTPEDKANIIHEVLESDEYQSVKGLVGTKEKPVNFNLLESGVYVFQGYISATAAGKTTTNTIPCPKELLLVREVLEGTGTEDGLTYALYMKIGYLFHTDIAESIFGDVSDAGAGAGVLGVVLAPSSIKFLGEWPEDKKNETLTKVESSSIVLIQWLDDWMADADTDYVTRDEISDMATKTYVSEVTANMATEQYVNEAISNIPPPEIPEIPPNIATTDYVDSAISDIRSEIPQDVATTTYVDNAIRDITFPPSLTEDQVNALIDAKLGVIENGHY